MKKALYLGSIIMLMIACKKEGSKSPIAGYWSGTGIAHGTTVSEFLGFLYRDDGTVRAYSSNTDTSLADKIEGTFSIDTDSIRTMIGTGASATEFAAAINDANTQMYGTFRRTTINYYGTYSVTKR
jgi:hypothetical protein